MLCIIRKKDERARAPAMAQKAGLHISHPQGGQRTSHRPARRPHQPVADARRPEGDGTGTRREDKEGLGVGLMLTYPITLEDDDGTVLATSPDFPELTTFGDDREEAVARAVHALEEAIAARIHDRKDIPTPSPGETYALLPTLTSGKGDAVPGDEGAGGWQGGTGPPPGVAHAAGRPRA